jgi:RNA polymerase sigma-70 factor (ECF subfamily)
VSRIQGIVKTLPAPYRAALVLRVFGGLSYQEIAEALGCSIGTVMSRINRARLRVRNRMGELERGVS